MDHLFETSALKQNRDSVLQLFDEGWDTKITKAIKIVKKLRSKKFLN